MRSSRYRAVGTVRPFSSRPGSSGSGGYSGIFLAGKRTTSRMSQADSAREIPPQGRESCPLVLPRADTAPQVIAVEYDVVNGVPADISTSLVERSHLTMRQSCKRSRGLGWASGGLQEQIAAEAEKN